MRAASFYWRWLKTASTHAIGLGDLWEESPEPLSLLSTIFGRRSS
jgi:hypothetical protein